MGSAEGSGQLYAKGVVGYDACAPGKLGLFSCPGNIYAYSSTLRTQ